MMLTCPNCGAENREGSPFCRMCAASLDVSGLKAGAANPFYQNPVVQTEAATQIACPACKTLNDADWAFCQECGYKMMALRPKTDPVPAPPQAAPVVSPKRPFAPPAEPIDEMKTVAVSKLTQANPASTAADPKSATNDSPVSFSQEPAQVPKTVVHVAPNEFKPPEKPAQPPKPVAPPPMPELITEPEIHSVQPDYGATIIDTGSQLSAQLHSNEIACPKCSHKSAAGSMFCANCGAQVAVAATIVMSSIAATPPQGRLHLVMEGGQPGEVYDLKDETAIGRTLGDISFPHDGYMSSRHARIVRRGEDFVLLDEGSRNGTFVRIKNEIKLESGDMILIGKQLFRFEK